MSSIYIEGKDYFEEDYYVGGHSFELEDSLNLKADRYAEEEEKSEE